MVEQGVGLAAGLLTGAAAVLPATGEHQLLQIPQLLLTGKGWILLEGLGLRRLERGGKHERHQREQSWGSWWTRAGAYGTSDHRQGAGSREFTHHCQGLGWLAAGG